MANLRDFLFFADVPDDELAWFCDNSFEQTLESGDYFFREHSASKYFYIVLEGELQVTRKINGRETVIGTTPPGIVGGEVALLRRSPSHITARAILPTRLKVLDEEAFRRLFTACPVLGMRILETAAQRMQNLMNLVNQQEKMAALGKLSAGLAHELNNPAAAARRAAAGLKEHFPNLQKQALALSRLGLEPGQVTRLDAFQQDVFSREPRTRALPPLEQNQQEEALGDWLADQGVEDGWSLAEAFVSAGLGVEELVPLARSIEPKDLPAVMSWLYLTLDARGLLSSIEQSVQRISDLVGAVKSYTYMDRAPMQDVFLQQGLESTLVMLQHKLGDVAVVREYDPELPPIEARGSELNQIWTNLIDNAIDAMQGKGELHIITRHEADYVMVEVRDSGPGIPPEVMPRLFEPFFTTKEVGVGTGLGLDISYRIVQQHHGTIEAQSQPGLTRFIVRLPLKQPQEVIYHNEGEVL